jgi:hypothetical protein
MILKKIFLDPNDFNNQDNINKMLEGATHVETYTKKTPNWGEERTLVIFAFYPDEERINKTKDKNNPDWLKKFEIKD